MTGQRRAVVADKGYIVSGLISSSFCFETEEMLLRGSFSKARALLKDSLYSVKSFFSSGYQRLPKTPPFSAFSCGGDAKQLQRSFRELDNFYDGFSQQWETSTAATNEKKKKKKKKKDKEELQMITEKTGLAAGDRDEDIYNGSFMGFAKFRPSDERQQLEEREDHGKRIRKRVGKEEEGEELFSQNLRVELCCTVADRLRKLEQLDASNVEHVLDIEEVLHYYSRIKCPFYVDIFNKFFMEMYAEFLTPTSGSCRFCRRNA